LPVRLQLGLDRQLLEIVKLGVGPHRCSPSAI
jgi:hypothetical protein